ncbi:DUF4102 domain-containing protein [Serratia marcescens]|jgi:hypothetical protein|nr:DUF4102 domain-containing protein [Serratia marcescens]MBH2968294.1 DUF4102 domain-containing protein [Serratia marcescens]MBN5182173.1 DUF4102 domain-containing protein [Serratia marcescens]MBN6136370.1 DUF4102 domain-containing protein [Serratia marcescens]
MALSDTTIRQAKAVAKACTLGDTDGLALAVSPEGNKSWHFRYSWNSKQKWLSLGTTLESPSKKPALVATSLVNWLPAASTPASKETRTADTPFSLRITPSRRCSSNGSSFARRV